MINMRPRVKLAVVGIAALLLGLAIAYPLFTSNVERPPQYPNGRAYLGLDVVYAYFSTQPVGQSITGLYRNGSDPASVYGTTGSFFVVLNITNYSNASFVVSKLSVSAAQQMAITNTPSEFGQSITYPFFEYHQTYNQEQNLSKSDDLTWKPYESRLIALSGINQFSNRTLLQTGTFYIGGSVEGNVVNGLPSIGGGAKLIHAESFGNEYLYNDLVSGNETLRVYPSSIDVQIVSGS